MAKYGFSTTIPYGNDTFEVTGVEYCAWEDALEACGEDTNSMEWATYDFLIGEGYLISEPKNKRPETTKQTNAKGQSKKARTQAGDSSPGIRDTPDTNGVTIDGNTREPVWTQSRILQERDRLLKEREKIQSLKETALKQKILEKQLIDEYKPKPKHVAISEGVWIVLGVIAFLFFCTLSFKIL